MNYPDPVSFSNEEKNKIIGTSKKIDKVMNVVLLMFFIIAIICSIVGDTRIGIKNAKKTEGELLEIKYRYINEDDYKRNILNDVFDMAYANILVKYKVDGVEYVLEERRDIFAIDWDPYDGREIDGWRVGDKVKVLYDEENPKNAAVDKIEFYEIVLYFVTGIVALVCICIKYKEMKRKSKKEVIDKEKRNDI